MKNCIPHPKPWVICRLGVKPHFDKAQCPPSRLIRRYVNRQDADSASGNDVGASDDLRTMNRFVKDDGQYVVAFDVIEIEE